MSGSADPQQINISALSEELRPLQGALSQLLAYNLVNGFKAPGFQSPYSGIAGVGQQLYGGGNNANQMRTGLPGTSGTIGPFTAAQQGPMYSGSRVANSYTPSYQNQTTAGGEQNGGRNAKRPGGYYDGDTPDEGRTATPRTARGELEGFDPSTANIGTPGATGPLTAPLTGSQMDALQGFRNMYNPTPIVNTQNMQQLLGQSAGTGFRYNGNIPYTSFNRTNSFFDKWFGNPGGQPYNPNSVAAPAGPMQMGGWPSGGGGSSGGGTNQPGGPNVYPPQGGNGPVIPPNQPTWGDWLRQNGLPQDWPGNTGAGPIDPSTPVTYNSNDPENQLYPTNQVDQAQEATNQSEQEWAQPSSGSMWTAPQGGQYMPPRYQYAANNYWDPVNAFWDPRRAPWMADNPIPREIQPDWVQWTDEYKAALPQEFWGSSTARGFNEYFDRLAQWGDTSAPWLPDVSGSWVDISRPELYPGLDLSTYQSPWQTYAQFAAGPNVYPEQPVDQKAGGGMLDPTKPTVVGERGPELIVGNTVIPNHMLQFAADGGVFDTTSMMFPEIGPGGEQLPFNAYQPQMYDGPMVNSTMQPPTATGGASMPQQTFQPPQQATQQDVVSNLLPEVQQSYSSALVPPRFDLTNMFKYGEQQMNADLERAMANAKEEMSTYGLNPGAADRSDRLTRAAGDVINQYRLGQQNVAMNSFESAENRRLQALGLAPSVANFAETPFNRELAALPYMMQMEANPFQEQMQYVQNVYEPSAQRQFGTLGYMPTYYNMPFDISERMYGLGEQARGVADIDLMRQYGDYNQNRYGGMDQIMSLLTGMPGTSTAMGPSTLSQAAQFIPALFAMGGK